MPVEKGLKVSSKWDAFNAWQGYMEVIRTGASSAAGSLAVMIGAIEAEQTPLERRLRTFGTQIARWVLLLAGAIVVAGVFVEGYSRLGHILLFALRWPWPLCLKDYRPC